MHIDAFFEYCLGKPHPYFTQIPADTLNGGNRDGVPLEEDLALRALHPESRPKRGRRKTEDRNEDNLEKDIPSSKRQHLEVITPSTAEATSAVDQFHSSLYAGPHSAVPNSNDPDTMERYHGDPGSLDPWSATPTATGPHFRWRGFSKEATTPNTSTPILSLETPTDEPMTPTVTTPMSAKSRTRRRHGPAVSSAWPSSGNPVTGKLRGRPPSNRSVRDGPFSTFPVNPAGKLEPGELGNDGVDTPASTPVVISIPSPPQFPVPQSHRPSGLHLQVPPRRPSTVKMATPIAPQAMNGHNPFQAAGSAVEDLERTFAANLLQGANWELSLDEAKAIAQQAVSELRRLPLELNSIPEHSLLPMLKLLLGCDSNTSALFRDFTIQKISGDQGGSRSISDNSNHNLCGRFKLTWRVRIGPLKGDFTQIVSFGSFQRDTDSFEEDEKRPPGFLRNSGSDLNGSEFDWRKKYFELEKRLREKEEEISTIKRKVLHAVM